MLISAIFWILIGSACLWIFLLDVILFSWTFSLVNRVIWGKKKDKKDESAA